MSTSRGITGFNPTSRGYSTNPPSHGVRRGTVPNGNGSSLSSLSTARVTPPTKENKGIIASFCDFVVWGVNGIFSLLFYCIDSSNETGQTAVEEARNEMIPVILNRWFPQYPKLGKHIEADALIEDLNKLPEPVFKAISYAFFNGNQHVQVSVENFVNDCVMKVDESREIQDELVITSLKALSAEEFIQVRDEFFQDTVNPGPLSVEVFVRGHVMKNRLGNRLHAGHLIQDLQGLPGDILTAVYTAFFQGQVGAPANLTELTVDDFVNNHVAGIVHLGALARLENVLRLQLNVY